MMSVIFFFQAEDGIRDSSVTGVQTCALPICPVMKKVVTQRDFETCSSKMKPKKRRKKTLLAMWRMLACRKMAVRTVQGNMGVGASHWTNRSRIIFPESNGSKKFPTNAPRRTETADKTNAKTTVGDQKKTL